MSAGVFHESFNKSLSSDCSGHMYVFTLRKVGLGLSKDIKCQNFAMLNKTDFLRESKYGWEIFWKSFLFPWKRKMWHSSAQRTNFRLVTSRSEDSWTKYWALLIISAENQNSTKDGGREQLWVVLRNGGKTIVLFL